MINFHMKDIARTMHYMRTYIIAIKPIISAQNVLEKSKSKSMSALYSSMFIHQHCCFCSHSIFGDILRAIHVCMLATYFFHSTNKVIAMLSHYIPYSKRKRCEAARAKKTTVDSVVWTILVCKRYRFADTCIELHVVFTACSYRPLHLAHTHTHTYMHTCSHFI